MTQLVAEPPEGSDGDLPPLAAHACDLDRALVSRYRNWPVYASSMSHFSLRRPYLKLIADGIKTIEVRVDYPKMHRTKTGHQLTFASSDDTVVTRVKRVTEYDIEALLDHEDTVAISGGRGEAREELLAVIREI